MLRYSDCLKIFGQRCCDFDARCPCLLLFSRCSRVRSLLPRTRRSSALSQLPLQLRQQSRVHLPHHHWKGQRNQAESREFLFARRRLSQGTHAGKYAIHAFSKSAFTDWDIPRTYGRAKAVNMQSYIWFDAFVFERIMVCCAYLKFSFKGETVIELWTSESSSINTLGNAARCVFVVTTHADCTWIWLRVLFVKLAYAAFFSSLLCLALQHEPHSVFHSQIIVRLGFRWPIKS